MLMEQGEFIHSIEKLLTAGKYDENDWNAMVDSLQKQFGETGKIDTKEAMGNPEVKSFIRNYVPHSRDVIRKYDGNEQGLEEYLGDDLDITDKEMKLLAEEHGVSTDSIGKQITEIKQSKKNNEEYDALKKQMDDRRKDVEHFKSFSKAWEGNDSPTNTAWPIGKNNILGRMAYAALMNLAPAAYEEAYIAGDADGRSFDLKHAGVPAALNAAMFVPGVSGVIPKISKSLLPRIPRYIVRGLQYTGDPVYRVATQDGDVTPGDVGSVIKDGAVNATLDNLPVKSIFDMVKGAVGPIVGKLPGKRLAEWFEKTDIPRERAERFETADKLRKDLGIDYDKAYDEFAISKVGKDKKTEDFFREYLKEANEKGPTDYIKAINDLTEVTVNENLRGVGAFYEKNAKNPGKIQEMIKRLEEYGYNDLANILRHHDWQATPPGNVSRVIDDVDYAPLYKLAAQKRNLARRDGLKPAKEYLEDLDKEVEVIWAKPGLEDLEKIPEIKPSPEIDRAIILKNTNPSKPSLVATGLIRGGFKEGLRSDRNEYGSDSPYFNKLKEDEGLLRQWRAGFRPKNMSQADIEKVDKRVKKLIKERGLK